MDVVITFMERSLGDTPDAERRPFALERVEGPAAAAMSAAMYRAVGEAWHWTDRRDWTGDQWAAAVDRADVALWIARVAGTVAGYFELHLEPDAVELKYFGLVPAFTGQRLGGPLLRAAIAAACTFGRSRMTLNTCTLDHPSALRNYLRHGFGIVRTESEQRAILQ